ncbi:acyl carrier protein [Streptomyces sp. NPDC101181]|uniref:acyl carrier protein n=1 Tax=Streptomyces sp. NPDC101181 TaxID=3366125 RepID=UPI00382111D1
MNERTAMTTDRVRAIWRRELHRDPILPDDDFFALGGDSVVMVRIQGAFIEELGAEITMDQLFLHPTVESIAAYIDSRAALTP